MRALGVFALDKDDIARFVLTALGGKQNVLSNTVCMTRLRVTLENPQAVDYDSLNDVPCVLGTAVRGSNGLEVVFGPRMIDGIYHSFIQLTGLASSTDALFPMSRQDSIIRVQIHANARPSRTRTQEPRAEQKPLIDEHELSILDDLFGDASTAAATSPVSNPQLLVINGPNLNMLGLQALDDPSSDFSALLQLCKDVASEVGFERCVCFQSNHEGDLIDHVQDAYGVFDAIVINPGTCAESPALTQALELVSMPVERVTLDSATATADDFDVYGQAIADVARRLGI